MGKGLPSVIAIHNSFSFGIHSLLSGFINMIGHLLGPFTTHHLLRNWSFLGASGLLPIIERRFATQHYGLWVIGIPNHIPLASAVPGLGLQIRRSQWFSEFGCVFIGSGHPFEG